MLVDNVSGKEEIIVGSAKINTTGYKIAFIDYYDCTDSINTTLLINKYHSCALSDISSRRDNFFKYADSIREIQYLTERDGVFSQSIYRVANDTIYYYQSRDKIIRACIAIPTSGIFIEISGYPDSRKEIMQIVNELIYYNKGYITWNKLGL